jgi:uncharacterized SAM-binding protein YcdF (DUF218 family)
MNALVSFVLSTTGAVTALLAAAFWIARRPKSHAARKFLIGAAAAYALASTYAVPALVTRLLSAGYRPFTEADTPIGPVALVVLGSGSIPIDGWDGRLDIMTDIEAARVLEAARVFRLADPALVISSGGLASPEEDSQPSGLNMRDELVRLGIPESRIIVEIESVNTRDEARVVTPILRERGIKQIILVTSDSHMRRALGLFRAFGWNAMPAITPDPHFRSHWSGWLIPSGTGLEFSRQVSRELIGLPYYWARGWWRF